MLTLEVGSVDMWASYVVVKPSLLSGGALEHFVNSDCSYTVILYSFETGFEVNQ